MLSEDLEELGGGADEERPPDPKEDEAASHLERFFAKNREAVYFSRQLEVIHEDRWFHWITNRALGRLNEQGLIKSEERKLASGGKIILLWHRAHRYYRRDATKLVNLVEEYANPNIGSAIGLNAELLVLEGFAKCEFVTKGRNTKSFRAKEWTGSGHDLDFIFERDGIAYGVEVKNKLGYMDYKELKAKLLLCKALGIRPLIVARMLPKAWIKEIIDAGGFALIMKWQLYPYTHKELARRVKAELGLPVDAPKALESGTVARFERWHVENV
jgi:hypothetical protein